MKFSDDEDIGPALPSNFNPTSSKSFPELMKTDEVVELSSSDGENCWVVERKSKKEKKSKKENKHKKEKKKKHKKDKH